MTAGADGRRPEREIELVAGTPAGNRASATSTTSPVNLRTECIAFLLHEPGLQAGVACPRHEELHK